MPAYMTLPKTEVGSIEWLEQRNQGVGSSDCSAIFGMSSYNSPYSLWLTKTGRAPLHVPVSEKLENLREMGHVMEPVIRELTAKRLGIAIEKDDRALASVERPWQHFNPDGLTKDGAIFEAKNVSFPMRHEWDGQISDHAELQVHHGAAVTGASHAIVAALVAGNDLRITTVEINPNVVEMIIEEEEVFWRYVEEDREPPIDAHIKTMEAITAEWAHHPGAVDVATVDAARWIEQYHEATADIKAAEERKREAEAHLAKLLQGHDRLVDGKRVLARTQLNPMSSSKLRDAHPDIYSEYLVDKPSFDLARFKKERPEMYQKFRGVKIIPTTLDEE